MTPPLVPYQPRWRVKPVIEWATLALAVLVPPVFGTCMLWYTNARPRDALDFSLGLWMIALVCLVLYHWVGMAGALSKVADAGFRHDLWLTGRAPREVILGEVFKRARYALYQVGGVLVCIALGFQVGGGLGSVEADEMIPVPLMFLGATLCSVVFAVRFVTGMASVRGLNRALGLGILHVLMVPILFYLLLVPFVAYVLVYSFSFQDVGMDRRLNDTTGLPVAAANQDLLVATLLMLAGLVVAAAGFVPRIERNLRHIASWFGVFEGRPEPTWAPVLSTANRWPIGKLGGLAFGWVVLAWLHVSLFFDEIIGLESDNVGLGIMALLSAGLLITATCGLLGVWFDQQTRRQSDKAALVIAVRAAPGALGIGLATLAVALAPAVGGLHPLFRQAPGSQTMEDIVTTLLIHGGLVLAVSLLGLVWSARTLFLAARGLGEPEPKPAAWSWFAVACAELFWIVIAVPLVWLVPNAFAQFLQGADPVRTQLESALHLRAYEGPVLVLLLVGVVGLVAGLSLVLLTAWRWASVHARWREGVAPREPLASDPPATAPSVP